MKKSTKIILWILGCILGLILLFVLACRMYFRIPVHSYYKDSKKEFIIPDLNNGFIPQGISYDEATDNFYVSGYMGSKEASPIYIINRTSKKKLNKVLLADMNGDPMYIHSGGLTVYGNKIYVAGGSGYCLYVYNKSDIDSAEKNAFVKCCDIVKLYNEDKSDALGSSFTTTANGMIFTGEFAKDGNYPTPEWHKTTTADGSINKGRAIGFTLNGTQVEPKVCYSIPELVQGMCFKDNMIYLSTSWGPSFSHIYVYDLSKTYTSGSYKIPGTEETLPVVVLDSKSLVKDIKAAPMSEEIEFVDGRFYIMSESASNKYIFGKLTGGWWCHSSNF